jgi:uncharacterized membrane protein YccC
MSVYKIDNAHHRAKRKAYIEEVRLSPFLFPVVSRIPQLEETMTKLQRVLGQFTFEQVAVLPPPLAKIRELEAENARLMHENYDLHRTLSDTTAGPCCPHPQPLRRRVNRSRVQAQEDRYQ